MSEATCLPRHYVRPEVTEFIQVWGINNQGLLLPGNGQSDLCIWPGTFISDETVVMVADAETEIGLNTGLIYVGTVPKGEYDKAVERGVNPLEVYAGLAFSPTRGLYDAIGGLIVLKGFPEARQEAL